MKGKITRTLDVEVSPSHENRIQSKAVDDSTIESGGGHANRGRGTAFARGKENPDEIEMKIKKKNEGLWEEENID